jgi:hypothetical protein
MMLLLEIYEKKQVNDQHLQYVHEDQNQLNVLVNNVLMDVPKRKHKQIKEKQQNKFILVHDAFHVI